MVAKPKLFIAWTEVTGYTLACWSALDARGDVDLRVVAGSPGSADDLNGYRPDEWAGLTLLGRHQADREAIVRRLASEFGPTVVVVSGWRNEAFANLVRPTNHRPWRVVLALDTSLNQPARQMLGRLRLARLLRRVDAFMVPGERGREFLARWWRISPHKIHTGLLGIDARTWQVAHSRRLAQPPWPRAFHFVGRYVPSKGIPELLAGYTEYRKRVRDPFPLACSGAGPLEGAVRRTAGVVDLGFSQPDALCRSLAGAGCFVLPSRYDPWGVALVEACAAGLPAIAAVGCGAAVEVLRDGYNGRLLRGSSPALIATTLEYMHEQYSAWPTMGSRSASLAEPYSAECWAENMARVVHELSETSEPA
jgi:glycosyltransferase involved in cell wall biosynthesis